MVATNSVAVRTGNVSAGTSVFAMIVLEKDLSKAYPEIDLVTTPDGSLVAMVHSNNCTSDYDAWIGLFGELTRELGLDIPKPKLYDTLLNMALQGDPDCGGLLAYGYVSGEHITHSPKAGHWSSVRLRAISTWPISCGFCCLHHLALCALA